jgi:hypothetical protein
MALDRGSGENVVRGKKARNDMFAAILLTISVTAMAQFGLFYWRALVASEAALPVSQEVLEAVNVASSLRGDDFQPLAELHAVTPDLSAQSGGLGFVPTYFKLMRAIGTLAAGRLSGLANWTEGERILCARYAAVQVERRLRSNLEMAASIRSC